MISKASDFFEAQPALPSTPDVFLLRQVIHDWSDKYAIKILKQLRLSAGPHTKLLIIDCVVEYACDTPHLGQSSSSTSVPAPLLPNLGGANLLTYTVDLAVSVINILILALI